MSLEPPYDLPTLASRLARFACPPRSVDVIPRAAVAAILRDPGGGRDAELLLIRRADRDGDPWSGHVAFPGGRSDPRDQSLLATALRETLEEVGLDLSIRATLLAELPEVPAVARHRAVNLVISPFVFALGGSAALTFDPVEVAEALWVPFGPLARGENAGIVPYEFEGTVLELPCLHVEGRTLWGLTYRMLQMLLDALCPRTCVG